MPVCEADNLRKILTPQFPGEGIHLEGSLRFVIPSETRDLLYWVSIRGEHTHEIPRRCASRNDTVAVYADVCILGAMTVWGKVPGNSFRIPRIDGLKVRELFLLAVGNQQQVALPGQRTVRHHLAY